MKMSIGFNTINRIRNIEARAELLGLKFGKPYGGYQYHESSRGEHEIGLYPKDVDSLPVYSRDAEIFTGTLDGVDNFLRGIEWHQDYLLLIKATSTRVIKNKEQSVRNSQMFDAIKGE